MSLAEVRLVEQIVIQYSCCPYRKKKLQQALTWRECHMEMKAETRALPPSGKEKAKIVSSHQTHPGQNLRRSLSWRVRDFHGLKHPAGNTWAPQPQGVNTDPHALGMESVSR